MPDILIRGMEMPHNDIKKISIYPNGDVEFWSSATEITVLRGAAHELPPHGDLIDVSKISLQEYEQAAHDALHNGKGSILYDSGVLAGARAIIQLVRRAPAVIPAEREKRT